MAEYHFHRDARTPFSEAYNVFDGEQAIGRVDIHFTSAYVYATLVVAESITREDVEELIELIDDDLVGSAEPERPDFVVTVYQGRVLGTYTDEDFEDSERENGNGHR